MNTPTAFFQTQTLSATYQATQNQILHHPAANMLVEERTGVEKQVKKELLRLPATSGKPPFLERIIQLLNSHGFDEQTVRIGLTGFGNTKTHLAEIGLVSTTPGFYNLHLGGNAAGNKLNSVYRINVPEAAIIAELNSLLTLFKNTRESNETFGEFTIRKNLI